MRFDRLGYKEKSTGLANCIRFVDQKLKDEGIDLTALSKDQADHLRNTYINKYLVTLDYNPDGSVNSEKSPNDNPELFDKVIREQHSF